MEEDIGAPADRTPSSTRQRVWHRQAADYFQSFGSLLQYFHLAEEAAPSPRHPELRRAASQTSELCHSISRPLRQDALDLIESPRSPSERVGPPGAHGHPARSTGSYGRPSTSSGGRSTRRYASSPELRANTLVN